MSTQLPSESLKGRKLLLGVCGGIAAYKTTELIRLFKKAGADVQVLMTPDASRFITPLTLGTLSEREVLIEIFPRNESGSWTKHVHLGTWAEVFIIAPVTAQTLAKLAHGHCDSMLTASALAARCPLLICPAMDHDMYLHPATQANLKTLTSFGYEIMEPEYGSLASGLTGTGRLPEPSQIMKRVETKLKSIDASRSVEQTLKHKKVLVTAGPTHEPIDPVRFITNHSTGTMGYELARAAAARGAEVVLVSGPTSLSTPTGVERIDITTAHQMYEAVHQHKNADIIIMAAAVSDFTPSRPATEKIKKNGNLSSLPLKATQDILASLGEQKRDGQILVGFAMETEHGVENALIKLKKKNLNWIVLNNLKESGAGFGTTTNKVTLFNADGHAEDLPIMPKLDVAEAILDRIT